MELARLIHELSLPGAYPEGTGPIEVRQTHISVVFLAGAHVYKVKKPVKLGFLDFSTAELRRIACFDEVRLNRRLAPDVYLGVLPIVLGPSGLVFEGEGEPVDWAVKMRRLPDDASLLARLGRGELTSEVIERVAARLAAFHAGAERPPSTRTFGGLDAVAKNARDNFEEMAPDVGTTVSRPVFDALRERTDRALAELGPLIASRAERGETCEGHGDLRLEHIYVFPDREPPNDLVVIDCVEFSERLRVADPVSDAAFTVMELVLHGERDLAGRFIEAYFDRLGQDEARVLLPFYVAYRSLVRAKVRGIEVREKEIPKSRRDASLAKARAHCFLALGQLENAKRRPLLVLVGGLPGTGKSTLARGLAAETECEVIRSDVVRKELATAPADRYSPAEKARTYDECLRRAEERLLEGRRVIVDATFAEERHRRTFLDLARSLSVPVVWFVCRASPACVRDRLAARSGDASDADWAIYEGMQRDWELESDASRRARIEVDTEPGAERAVARAREELVTRRLS